MQNKDYPKLRECPFCGSENVGYYPIEEQHYENYVEGFIWCRGCNFSSDVFLDEEIAADAWNRRVNADG